MSITNVRSWLAYFIAEEGGQAITEYGGVLSMVSILIVALFTYMPVMQWSIGALAEGMCAAMNKMAAGASQHMTL